MDKRKSKFPSVDPLYLRHLRWLLTGVVALMLCLSLTLFFTFERMARKIVFNDAITLLDQTAESTADMMDTCVQITNRIQSDKVISPILFYSSTAPGDTAIALEQLSLYKHTVQSINSIYIYNARSGKVYISDPISGADNYIQSISSFSDTSALEMIENYTSYPAYTAVPRLSNSGNCYTLIGYGFNNKSANGSLNSAVLVNISAGWLQNLITPSETEPTAGETLIINKEGKIVSDSTNFTMNTYLLDVLPETGAKICDSQGKNENGYFIAHENGSKCFVAYTAPDDMGWQYVRIIPYSTIISGISRMRRLTIAILFGFLIVGLLVSWYLNRLLYRPIDQYKEDISRLETSERESFPALKQAFLRKLLLTPNTGADLTRRLESFSCDLDPEKPCYVAMIKLDHYQQFDTEMPAADAERYRYAILNIGCEIAGKYFRSEGVDLQRNRMVMILTVKDQSPTEQQLRELLTEMREAITRSLSLSVSISISEEGSFNSLLSLYETADENGYRRLFSGDGSIIIGKKDNAGKEYRYPEKKEKVLAEALSRGNLDKAKKVYLEIVEGCWDSPLYIFNTTVLRLVSMCNQVAGNIQSMQHNAPFFINLGHIENIDQLHDTFDDIFSAITMQVLQNAGSRSDQQIEAINAQIESRYADPALSIESIADTLGLSASYTGRIYKQATGMTILERILEVRMTHARSLLESTDEPVAAVSEKTGFSSDSYFYKIFKQENGITPAAYRKKFSSSGK